MQKMVALSVLQSLVPDHNKPIYQEALDCLKKNRLESVAQSDSIIDIIDRIYAEFPADKQWHRQDIVTFFKKLSTR